MKRALKVALSAAALFAGAQAQAAVYNLNSDWSNASNPNGVWTLRQGTTALPSVASWLPVSQAAWAYGNAPGSFLPGFFKANASGAVALGCPTCDWQAGDVVLHTTDAANGIGAGMANVLFVAPNAGTATVSGLLWAAQSQNRTQEWALFLNGTPLSAGNLLPGDGSNGSGAPDLFNFGALSLATGDQLELRIFQNGASPFGDFVGLNVSVDLVAPGGVPEPASWALMIAGFGAVGAGLRRRSTIRVTFA